MSVKLNCSSLSGVGILEPLPPKGSLELGTLQKIFARSIPLKGDAPISIDFEAMKIKGEGYRISPLAQAVPVHYSYGAGTGVLEVTDPFTDQSSFYDFVRAIPQDVRDGIREIHLDVTFLRNGPLLSLFPNLEKLVMKNILFESLEGAAPNLKHLEVAKASGLKSLSFVKGSTKLETVILKGPINLLTLEPLKSSPIKILEIPGAYGLLTANGLDSAAADLESNFSGVRPSVLEEFKSKYPHLKIG